MSHKKLYEEYPDTILAERLSLSLEVKFVSSNGTIKTLEGEVAYKKGDAIVTGIHGEKWPVSRQRFEETYIPCENTIMGQNGVYKHKPAKVYGYQLQKPIIIHLSDGKGVLHGKAGDWLIEYPQGDRAIIDNKIFHKTYGVLKEVAQQKNTQAG